MRQARSGWLAVLLVVPTLSAACGSDIPPTPAPPAIAFISPSVGFTYDSTAIEIFGSRFVPGASVRIDGTAVTAVVYSAGRITATAPPHAAGSVDVVVTNPDGRNATRAGGFSYVHVPLLPGDLSIRPGESITSTLVGTSLWCTDDSIACRRVFVEGETVDLIELEVTPAESGKVIGLFRENTFQGPTDFPPRLIVGGGRVVFIMGELVGFTVTARPAGAP